MTREAGLGRWKRSPLFHLGCQPEANENASNERVRQLNLRSWKTRLAAVGIGSALWASVHGAEPLFQSRELFIPTSTNYYHIPGLVVTAEGDGPGLL
jgi:hypothetical protein